MGEYTIEKLINEGFDIISNTYDFKCDCGNTVVDDSFYTWEEAVACDEIENMPWENWNFTVDGCIAYRCYRCGRISILKDEKEMPLVDGRRVLCYGSKNGRYYYMIDEEEGVIYTDHIISIIAIGR